MSEIQYLERVIQDPEGVSVQGVADFLGRTVGSVNCQISRVKKQKFPDKKNTPLNGWTKEEVTFLKKAHSQISYSEIARELGKPVKAVRMKALRLGLRRNRPKLKYSDVKEYATGEYSIKEIAFELGSTYDNVRKFLERHPELKYKRVKELKQKELREREHKRWQYYKKISSNSRT